MHAVPQLQGSHLVPGFLLWRLIALGWIHFHRRRHTDRDACALATWAISSAEAARFCHKCNLLPARLQADHLEARILQHLLAEYANMANSIISNTWQTEDAAWIMRDDHLPLLQKHQSWPGSKTIFKNVRTSSGFSAFNSGSSSSTSSAMFLGISSSSASSASASSASSAETSSACVA